MLNQCIFVGTVISKRKYAGIHRIKIEVMNDHMSQTNIIPIELWEDLPQNVVDMVTIGSKFGIKGRVRSYANGKIAIVAEKLTFINTKERY